MEVIPAHHPTHDSDLGRFAGLTTLLDADATLHNLRQALAAVTARSQPQDTVVIYFSGHGAILRDLATPESALLPVDTIRNDLRSSSLTEAEFTDALRAIKSERLVVLLDACHSDGAGSFKGENPDGILSFGYSEKSLSRLAQGIGRVLIASSRESETSLIFHGARNSLFTEHLLAALRGGAATTRDGLIRVFEVFNYVAEKVKSATPSQHPIFKASNLEDNFPIALECGGFTKASVSIARPDEKDIWKQLEMIMAELYPCGPIDQEIWNRAGGDLSRLKLQGPGRANWISALRTLRLGGGGDLIGVLKLVQTSLEDFPHHARLLSVASAFS
jgi:hypothetical protein